MTHSKSTPEWSLSVHQVILLDEEGRVYESCDTIFDTAILRGRSIHKQISFFTSEFNTILKSTAEIISFEKIQIEEEYLPGYYDFVFTKREIKGQSYIVWDVYDYTKIYEQYINVQQLSNEIDIQEQFQKRKIPLSTPNPSDGNNFFQSNYIAENLLELNNLICSKFDAYDLLTEQQVSQLVESKPCLIKRNLNFLIDEIRRYLKNIKRFQESLLNIREFCSAHFQSQDKSLGIEFEDSLPANVCVDGRLVAQLVQLLCKEKSNTVGPNSSKMIVNYKDGASGRSELIFCLKEKIDGVKAFLNESACIVVKLSVLQSLLSAIGGTLESNYLKEERIFSISLSIPVK